jgi:diguanylate cyclase (GGDEF)-like protein
MNNLWQRFSLIGMFDENALRAIAMATLDDGGHGIGVFNSTGHLHLSNATFRRAFADHVYSNTTWPGMLDAFSIRKRLCAANKEDMGTLRRSANRKRHDCRVRRFAVNQANGRCFWVTEISRNDGWLAVLTTDITPLKAHERALQCAHDEAVRVANTDELTGIYNRRYILNRLEQALATIHSTGAPFCVCLFDLDHFKSINDTYGHAAGDLVIRHFTDEMRRHLRPTDVFGRIGGEEFLLLLHDTSVPDGIQIVERVRRLLGSASPALAVSGFKYTFSAGLTIGQSGDTGKEVLHRADRALYEAKRMGRDRHVALMADPVPTSCLSCTK